jgi:hypothetical protein
MTKSNNTIMDNSVMIRLSFGHLGSHRKADKNLIETGNTQKDSLNVSKRLFECDSYHAIHKADGKVKGWLLDRAIQIDLGYNGVYILPLALLGEVDDRLTQIKKDRELLVDAFLKDYDEEREKARFRLGDQFKEQDYPAKENARSAFRMSWRYVQFKVPEKLPPEVLKRERAALEASMKDTELSVKLALREGMLQLVNHLADKLTPSEGGDKKVFRDSAVENLVEFLELLEKRDITNDEELRALSSKAKTIIGSATADDLRKAPAKNKRLVATALADIGKQVGSLVETVKKRKFQLED